MRLLMAVSYDGFLAKGPTDDMSWTGAYDKAVFRLLTMGQVVGAGRRTAEMLPTLPGRRTIPLSSRGSHFLVNGETTRTLHEFRRQFPNPWLIGGPTVARMALDDDLLTEVYMCHSQAVLWEGMPDDISPYLTESPFWDQLPAVQVGDVKVRVWRRV